MTLHRNHITTALAALCLCGATHAAQFYKWTDEQGITHYTTEPPPSGNSARLDIRLPQVSAPSAPAATTQKPVVIYTAEWCGVCRTAKKYFSENNITYTEYDVEKSSKGKADYQRLQGKGIPIILIGEARMDGFDAGRFEAMRK